jgi:hypothetical protein
MNTPLDDVELKSPRFPTKPIDLLSKLDEEQDRIHRSIDANFPRGKDPLDEAIQTVEELKNLVNNLTARIPKQVEDAMVLQGQTIESRISLMVRQHLQQQSLPTVELNPVLDAIDKSDSKVIASLNKVNRTPQPVSRTFYSVLASFGILSLSLSAFAFKTLNDRVRLAEWEGTPDGKLAKEIILANKNNLNKQCQASAQQLKNPVKVDGIDRRKLCLVVIP